jgi:small subunit ribosomal protein S12e
MSDAGDEIKVDAVETVEVAAEAPKGKLSVEDALQVLMSHRDLNTELNTE